LEKSTEQLEETHMAQAEKTAPHAPAGAIQNGGTNVVTLGPRDSLHGRLDIQGDLRVHGTVEGDLKASGDVAVESTASVQASIEGANVVVRGQVTGNVTAKRRLTLGGSGKLNGDVKVGRLTVEDGATLNGNVAMSGDKQG
jgi:cytoskeletal protein CcmA (bactofilin family)